MSEDKQVNQPQNDVPEVEVKETQTDNKPQPQPQFTQQDVDRIIKQRLESEKAKNQRALDEIKAKIIKYYLLLLKTKLFHQVR